MTARAVVLSLYLFAGGFAAPQAWAAPVAFDLVEGESLGVLSFEVTTAGGTPPESWGPGDWFGVAAGAAWPQSAGMPFALADDSVAPVSGGVFEPDTQGIIDSRFGATNPFLGAVDTVNGSNPGDTATATWTFDVSAGSDLVVAIDMAAMGDFEAAGDSLAWTYAIDGAPSQPLFTFTVDEAGSQSYTMEGGAVVSLDDPLLVNGVLLNDEFQTVAVDIPQTGSILTLSLTAALDGGSEAFAAANIVIDGDGELPEPPVSGGAGVLINEVLGNTAGDDAEFIELYNGGNGLVDLTGWSIELWDSDASALGTQDAGSPYALSAGATIEAGGFYLLANPLVAPQFGVSGDQALPENAIENSSYTIVLRDAGDQVVDAIFVTDGGEGDIANIAGEAIEPNGSLGPDGNFLPAGFFRSPEAGGETLLIQDFNFGTATPMAGAGGSGGEPQALTIPELQGAGHVSPFVDVLVETTGVVTAIDGGRFYLQDPSGDADPATSDAIVVTGTGVAVGDDVTVIGTVTEADPAGGGADLDITTLISQSVTVNSSGNALPEPVVLGRSGRSPPSEVIEDDNFASFEPELDGADYFEAVESMRVTVEDAQAVSGTNRFGEIFSVANRGMDATGISARGTLNISPDDFNPEKIQIDAFSGESVPGVDVGALLGNVTGVVSYDFGNYQVQPTEGVVATPASLLPESTELLNGPDALTVASYNVLNLETNEADGDTDVANGRFAAIATQIVSNLGAPDILGLQEIQDNSGSADDGTTAADVTLQALVDAIAAAGGPAYEFIDTPNVPDGGVGGQPGGNIRVAYLYNPERVSLQPGSVETIPVPPGGRIPLLAVFEFGGETISIVNNHLSSKGGSAPIVGLEQPFEGRQEDVTVNGSLDERQAQAQAVRDRVDLILAADADANVIVLGDLNEFEFVSPVATILGGVLENTTLRLPEDERYTFIFQGNSQALDHVLVSSSLSEATEVDVVHVNVEFEETPQRASDHDPVLIRVDLGSDGIMGTDGNDLLLGTPERDVIDGKAGNDSLIGLASDDVLIGGPDKDFLFGGEGADQFVYQALADAGDLIIAFEGGLDTIDLRGLLVDVGFDGADPFSAGVLRMWRFGSVAFLFVDPDGKAGPQRAQRLVTVIAKSRKARLTKADLTF